jgi:NADH dehydrogenase FAD-containing subunit
MTATAMPGAGQRHRVVDIGSGFGRLTATKALKHAETDITDALTFLTRIAARGTAHVHNQMSLWLAVIPTTAAVFTTAGVLFTLYVAISRRVGADHAIHRFA